MQFIFQLKSGSISLISNVRAKCGLANSGASAVVAAAKINSPACWRSCAVRPAPMHSAKWAAARLSVELGAGLWQSGCMVQQNDPSVPRATKASLLMSLLPAREAVMSDFRPMLDRHVVNEQQWRVIRVLAEAGELAASNVAERANILAPSLTRMIIALTECRLIVKARDEGDGRRAAGDADRGPGGSGRAAQSGARTGADPCRS